ncbi:uncharacterized protein LOC126737923 [Anthonomus grandis grandis]|uniref:uncharacterized protein LOC126737923 n=1 Tax=Anthonomus grandis grandis TaxID=2921223 RepID=UPI0021664130|nr:uncharacterized protein LOC126737923 [Anthonomus grandis grandis]XP_050298977.1 uncharacterized protein LOC126737923 [Anthonomus grandis grandis]XP_050298978.1 uncharacterized protein LOC126737923 [Anthonomus grandis grandis]
MSHLTQNVAVMLAIFILLLAVEIHCKPSLGGFKLRGPFNPKAESEPLKQYTGRKVSDSIRMVYFHDQTVAVVELGPRKLLLNCEIIEVHKPDEYLQVLGDLADTARPVGITLLEMLTLMDQCKELEEFSGLIKRESHNETMHHHSRGFWSNDPLSLVKGIIPGTKWCGSGDIANSYYDLGPEPSVDVCCRTHDLCPVKVRSRSTNYNLSNSAFYTKSHCECDDRLYNCLKQQKDIQLANFLGNIYFNAFGVECVADGRDGKREFRKPRRRF